MPNKGAFRRAALLIVQVLLLAAAPAACAERSGMDIIEEMAVYSAVYGDRANGRVDALLAEMDAADPDAALRWRSVMALWREVRTELPIHYGVLPDGLPDTDQLCIVTLGFQLNPDGTMRNELIGRLKVTLASAQRYPNAYIVCTGGGTTSGSRPVTEAGLMADWLIANGVGPDRLIVENRSRTTAQNAMFTLEILRERYPGVRWLAVVTSDYHIETGVLLFGAQALLTCPAGQELRVISNAAWNAPSGTFSALFQAGALIEMAGDTETAYDIYYRRYDVHRLPPLR